MRNINFKPAAVNDWKLVEVIEKASPSPLFASCADEEEYKKYLTDSTVYFIVSDDKTIGFISHEAVENDVTLISGLVVLPDHRRQGVATEALKKLLGELNGDLALYVHPENTPALLIYLRAGFSIAEWRDNVFGDGQPRLFLKKKV